MKASFPKLVLPFAVFALLAAPLAARAGLFSDSWRYKMTVEVETPEGLKTGSAVREVTVHRGLKLTPEMTSRVDLDGEAVAVDLGKRGVLFVLNSEDSGTDVLFKTFPGKNKKGSAVLTLKDYPLMVKFADVNNPKSVERVDYTNLAASFGEGVKLKEIAVEITRDPVTTRIEKFLPWLAELNGYISGKYISGPTFYEQRDSGEFERGNK